jgi:hypothetical protein
LVVALSSSAARQSAARARRDNGIKYLSPAWNVFPPDIKNANANSCHEGNQAKCLGLSDSPKPETSVAKIPATIAPQKNATIARKNRTAGGGGRLKNGCEQSAKTCPVLAL